MTADIDTVLHFWFEELEKKAWFTTDPDLDAHIKSRFGESWRAARDGGLDHWRDTPLGCVAHVIVLDQFPRNMHRGHALSYATDPQARITTETALLRGYDRADQLNDHHRQFLYMPLMHSEDLADQNECVRLAETRTSNEEFARHAHEHRDIVRRFGRFPHRNAVLGRESTDAEKAFLASGESPF